MPYISPRATSVEIQGLGELRKQLKQIAERGIIDAIEPWFVKIGAKISADAMQRLTRPGGGRFTGRLANSLGHIPATTKGGVETIKGKDSIELRVGTNVKYARFVEGWPHPPRRHFLPYKGHPNFVKWSRRIRGTPWSEIRREGGGLMVGGKKSIRPFLLPALKQNIPFINTQLEKALETAR